MINYRQVVTEIEPVILLIRKQGLNKIALKRTKEAAEELLKKKSLYEELISNCEQFIRIKSTSKELKVLKKYLEETSRKLESCIKEEEMLQENYNQLENEISKYIEYTDLFTGFTYEDYKNLMNNHSFYHNSFKYEAIVFLSVNHGISEEEREKIRKNLDKKYHGYNMFSSKDEDIRQNYIHFLSTHFP